MVCTGNICRSPTADGILRKLVADAGLGDRIEVDGAGMEGWHTGDGPSRLAVEEAARHGYDLSPLRARQIKAADYQEFDLILAMDDGHMARLKSGYPDGARAELAMFLDADRTADRHDVPDPYYGGADDYRYSFELIESGCKAWLDTLRERV